MICAALSNAIALMARQQEALIGISQFLSLPMTFLSSAIMDPALAPHWIQVCARYNPLDWAVVASRETLLGNAGLVDGLAPPRRPRRARPGDGDARDAHLLVVPAVDLGAE